MEILIFSKYDQNGASSRYRHYNYIPYFEKNGINYTFKPLLENNYIQFLYEKRKCRVFRIQLQGILKRFWFLLFYSSKYDLIIIEKELFPNIPYFLEKMFLKNKKYSMDYDDYVAANYFINPVKSFFLKDKIYQLVKNSKFVTVGNKWYFEEFKTPNLFYIPTVINLDKYVFSKIKIQNNFPIIVWIGSPYTVKYLQIVEVVLKKLVQNYKFMFKIIGSKYTIKDINLINITWTEENEVVEVSNSDIGIMPLEETIWEKGKCGLKLIQYMACGIPVVASPSPANIEIVDHGGNGYIANNNTEWYNYLETLITDFALRKRMGERARQKIESNYSYQIFGDKYCKIIQDNVS